MTGRAPVLVAGAGDVGSAVAVSLRARGDQVLALRRDIARLPPGVDGIAADLTDPESLRALPQGLGALVYCAAADRSDEAAYRSIYVDGLRNVLAAVGSVERVVFTSTTGVYGQRDGEWVDEDSPAQPARFTGRVMLEAEAIALGADAGRSHALRLGGIYGPGRNRLIEQVRRGEATCVAGRAQHTNRIHRDDAASAVVHVLDHFGAPAVLNVVDDDPSERCEVLRWIAERLGVPPPRTEPAGASTRVDDKRVSNARLRSLGWRPRYPSYRDGYAALIPPPSGSLNGNDQ